MSSMYIRQLIFSCNLWSLFPPMHFKSMWLSSIIPITNSKDDSASPWKIPLRILTLTKLFLPATLQFFKVFSINFMTSTDILYILILIYTVTTGNRPDDNRRKYRWQLKRLWTAGKTAIRSMVDQHFIMYIPWEIILDMLRRNLTKHIPRESREWGAWDSC